MSSDPASQQDITRLTDAISRMESSVRTDIRNLSGDVGLLRDRLEVRLDDVEQALAAGEVRFGSNEKRIEQLEKTQRWWQRWFISGVIATGTGGVGSLIIWLLKKGG